MALVTKILESTLIAGQTSVTFNDADLPNSLIRVYTTNSDLFPVSQSLTGNTLTVTFEAQTSNLGVAVEIAKQGLEIVDNVTSEDTDKALSAKQGKVLKDAIDSIVVPTVPENITDLDDVDVTNIQNNQVLAWNALTEKFENVDQSGGGGSDVYNDDTTQAYVIGTVGTKTLYRRYFEGSIPSSGTSTRIFNEWDSTNYTLLNVFGEVKKGTNSMQIGAMLYGYTDSWFSGVMIQGTQVNLWFGSTFRSGTYKVWVEYYA